MKNKNVKSFKTIKDSVFGIYFQGPVDFYIYFLIQKLAFFDTEEASGGFSVYVRNVHFEPLKILLKHFGEKGC